MNVGHLAGADKPVKDGAVKTLLGEPFGLSSSVGSHQGFHGCVLIRVDEAQVFEGCEVLVAPCHVTQDVGGARGLVDSGIDLINFGQEF